MNTEPINRIRQLLSTDLDPWLRSCFVEYLNTVDKGATMDACLGLPSGRVNRLWWRRIRLRYRDACIHWLAKAICPDLSTNAQAAKVHSKLKRYQKARWRFDRFESCIPAAYIRENDEILFRVLSISQELSADIPGERQIRRILGHQPAKKTANNPSDNESNGFRWRPSHKGHAAARS